MLCLNDICHNAGFWYNNCFFFYFFQKGFNSVISLNLLFCTFKAQPLCTWGLPWCFYMVCWSSSKHISAEWPSPLAGCPWLNELDTRNLFRTCINPYIHHLKKQVNTFGNFAADVRTNQFEINFLYCAVTVVYPCIFLPVFSLRFFLLNQFNAVQWK